jgi:radical SAM superfamily enzyme YgiQ (UPF0313 family)
MSTFRRNSDGRTTPHVTFVPMTGFRVREAQMRELGMSLPGLQQRASAIAELPALGVLTLAGMTPEPWTCSYRGTSEVSELSIEKILSDRPDLIAISALTASIDEAYRLSARLRSLGIPTVIGGLHASVCPDEAEMHCDSVIVGRGESVWTQVLDDVLAGTLQRRYLVPLNTMPLWPMPRFDLLPQTPPRFTLQTQAGCQLACGFCGASRLLSRFAEKPVERIREELAVIQRLMPRPLIELADDNTFAGSRDVNPLFNALQDARARWFTEADWRIGERQEILQRLASSGCQQVLMGIESLVFRYPGMGEKQAELNRIMNAVDAIQSAGVAVNGCFIIGADGETAQSLESLTEFLLNCSLAEIQVTLQTPFPGTSLYRQLQSEGRLLTERGWSDYTLFDVTYRPDCMTVEDLEAGFRNVLRRVFSASASQRRNQIRRQIHRNARQFARKAS